MEHCYKFRESNISKFAFWIFVYFLFCVNGPNQVLNAQDFFGQTLGPTGRNDIQAISFDNQDNIYAATFGNGVLISTNNGMNWTNSSAGLGSLHVKAIMKTPNGSMMAATYGGGIYVTSDGGLNWVEKNTGLTNLFVKALCINKKGWIYAGTYGSGVFYSTDNGDTWIGISKGMQFRDVTALTVTIDSTVLAGTWGGGIYRLKNNAQSWSYGSTGIQIKYINGFCHDSVGHVYAASNGEGIIYSVSNGMEWSAIKYLPRDLNITSILINAKDELIAGSRMSGVWKFDSHISGEWEETNIKYVGVSVIASNSKKVLFAYAPSLGFYSSTNNGMIWQYKSLHELYAPNCVVSSKNGIVFSSLYGKTLYRSFDYGKNWTRITTIQHDTLRCLMVDSNYNIWAGTVKGLFKSTDNGNTWTQVSIFDMNNSRLVIQSMICHNNKSIYINGIFDSVGSNLSFIAQSSDGGANWTNLIEEPSTVYMFASHPNGDLYYISDTLYKSTDYGASYTPVNNLSIYNPLSLGISKDGIIYVGKNEGLYTSNDNCQTWVKDTFGLEDPDKPGVTQILCTEDNRLFTEVKYFRNIYVKNQSDAEYDSLDRSFTVTYQSALSANSESDIFYATSCLHRALNPKYMVPPEMVTPSETVGTSSLNPIFIWKNAKKADLYHFQISDDIEFSYILDWVIQSDTVFSLNKTLAFNKTYYFRIRSKTNSAYSKWSKLYAITTISAPPVLISPENISTGIHIPAGLLWHKSPGALKYLVQVSEDSSFANNVFEKLVTDTTVFADGLEYLKKYYWRVRAESNAGVSSWSEIWSFTTTLPPPFLIKPENGSSENPIKITFNWRSVPTGVNYQIQVAKSKDFDQVIYDSETDADTMHVLELLEYDNTYWWRVRAKNQFGIGAWCQPWSFSTGIAPITLRTPINDSINVALNMTFFWEQSEKAEFYQIQVAKDIEFKNIVLDVSDVTTTAFPDDLDEYFTYYYWRVREVRGDRRGNWSEIWRFRTVMNKPELKLPENNSTSLKRNLNLYWHKLTGAEYYHLQVAKDANFSDIVYNNSTITEQQQDIYDLEYNTKYYWRISAYRSDGATAWSDVWNFVTEQSTGINDFDPYELSLNIFPNPVGSHAIVNYYLPKSANVKISLISIDGIEQLSFEEGKMNFGEYSLNLNAANLPQGMYILKMTANEAVIIKRIIITK